MRKDELLLENIRACRICQDFLPLPPKPVLDFTSRAKILIAGQAPGKKVHDTGIPWNDPSGDRLRLWMGIDRATFYDTRCMAIVPMGFCYPGRGKSGDLPPRLECSQAWMNKILGVLPNLQLKIVIGQYSQAYYLQTKNVTETTKQWQQYFPEIIPLPHPSPRNNIWLKKNPWFEAELVPVLRQQVAEILNND